MKHLLAIVALLLLGANPGQSAYPLSAYPLSGPAASLLVSAAGTSTGTLNGSTCYRVGCVGAQVYWRVGVLPLTASTSDAPMSGTANCLAGCTERICLRAGYNGIAFITAPTTQAMCTVTAMAPAP